MMDTTDLEMPSTFIFIHFFITPSSTAKFTPTKYTFSIFTISCYACVAKY